MKSNVDLTMDRDFSSTRGNRLETLNDLVRSLDGNYPWSSVEKHHRDDTPRDELVITGSKIDRKNRSYGTFSDCVTCDCCGAYIERFPWEKESTLCKKCEEGLSKSVRKGKPWNNFWSTERVLVMDEKE